MVEYKDDKLPKMGKEEVEGRFDEENVLTSLKKKQSYERKREDGGSEESIKNMFDVLEKVTKLWKKKSL
jgi:hypothetical protein